MSQSEEDSESDHFNDEEDDEDEEEGSQEDDERGGTSSGGAGGGGGQGGGGLNLTGFLFGNIDLDGRLSEETADFLDAGSRAKLSGLSRLLSVGGGPDGDIGRLLEEEVTAEDNADDVKADVDDDFDSSRKDPSAQDFSAIDEALSDDSSSDENDDSSDGDVETAAKSSSASTEANVKKEQEIKSELQEVKQEEREDEKSSTDDKLMPPPSQVPVNKPVVKTEPRDPSKEKKPLSAMLPEKYRNVDVKELFPEFRQNSVLRFSRLFPIKASHKPRIWKNVKKRSKKRDLSQKSDKGADEDDEDSLEEVVKGWRLNYAEWPESLDAYLEDGVVKFHKPQEEKVEKEEEGMREAERKGPKRTDWRWGPAQYWYDMLGLPDTVDDYDYGLKSALEHMEDDVPKKDFGKKEVAEAQKSKDEGMKSRTAIEKIEFPPDAFLMVTQANWEEDVIWNGDDIRHKVMQKLSSKSNAAGWVPTGFNRTAGSFTQPGKGALPGIKLQTLQHKRPENGDDTFYSIFPVENEELAYGRWEDEVIWDTESMPKKLKPKMVSLDPNDDNIILGIPDDIDPSTLPSDQPVRKIKVIQKHVKKSRMLLNRSGIISVVEEESPPPPPKVDDKDPFNISNDEFYVPKAQEALIKVATGGTLLQHATPVVELQSPFVPTHIGPIKLRQFHRWPLKRFSHGLLANYTQLNGVNPLMKHMKKKAKARELEREAAGGGEIFFMRTPEDVSGKDGELVLFEFIEEHPPLLSLVGMACKIKNYYKRKPGSDTHSKNNYRYGELTLAHTSPFLGQMTPGQMIQTIENNLFRAPVYEHKMPDSDFVVIRTRSDYSIREADCIFTSGQECPLYEVPGPNSKRANNFARDFLQVFIYRLFWKSRDNPKRIKMDEIKRAFPAHSESSIRKRLKPCAEFHRTGHDSNWWVIKQNFRLPTEEEMRAMVTPEQCCAYLSMIAAEQRLRDAGYGEKFLLAQQDDDDEESAMKMDDEVKVAPWNTTRAYILAMKGKCLLQLTGPADPTGPAREGFSYVRIPNKPTNKEEQEQLPKRTVTGTDADLRKLPLKDARNILRKNGVPEDEIKKLTRWEVIDVVRTLSTEKVKAGEDGDHKFSRGNRFSIAEHQERYREESQRIFEVQNKVLASDEILSSDDAESSEEEDANDDDLDEMGKNIENMLSNKKTSTQFQREQEEAERRKLQKMIMGDTSESEHSTPAKRKRDDDDDDDSSNSPNKVLRITRVFKNSSGKEYTRTEFVRKPLVIETYMKVRETKDEAFIRQFATLDDTAKEEMKKEKRRIQEQLRRIKRNQEREKEGRQKTPKRRIKAKPDLKLKCGACGAKGHMRTNKACPKFVPGEFDGPLNVAMTEKDEEEMEKEVFQLEEESKELIKVDGIKMTLSAELLKHTDEVRKKTMLVKVPKKILKGSSAAAANKRRRAGTVEHCDYLSDKKYRQVKRSRTDPMILLASYLENLHGDLRVMDEALQFLQPVNTKKVPDYLDKVNNPMDLQTIRDSIQKKKYRSREDFLSDINQIVENSKIYNGGDDIYTKSAQRLLEVVIEKFSASEEKLMRLEKAINPLLSDNSQEALTYVINEILEQKIKSTQESWPFMKPVNRKAMKHYYDIITVPMDLETIATKVIKHAYHSRQEFLSDIELIFSNSVKFNGVNSEYTFKAQKILDITKDALAPYDDELSKLEEKIREVQRRALEDVEVDSIGTSLGGIDGMDGDDGGAGSSQPIKRKRGRPRKNKVPKSSEFVDVGSEDEAGGGDKGASGGGRRDSSGGGNLADDLLFSDDEDDDPDDEDWEQVGDDEDDEDEDVTVTIEEQPSLNVEDEQLVEMGEEYYEDYKEESVVGAVEEEQVVDENYDPTDFLHSLGRPVEVATADVYEGDDGEGKNNEEVDVAIAAEDDGVSVSIPGIVNLAPGSDAEVVAEGPIDVINEDLEISDSDSDDSRTEVAMPAPPLVPEPPPPDEDGLWF